jgi:hypothetical protein
MDRVTTPPAAGPFGPPAAGHAGYQSYQGPTRVQLAGALHGVRFPAACAACGAATRETLPLEKLFRRHRRRRGNSYHFEAVDVPFCDGCRARHAAELPPPDPAVHRTLRWQFVVRVLPYVIPLAVIAYLFTVALLPMAAGVAGQPARAADGTPNYALLGALGIFAFFAACLAWFLVLVNRARRNLVWGTWTGVSETHVRRELLLFGRNAAIAGPPTSVLAAVDFSDDRAELFEPERHTFTFRDATFAEQFRSLNADRVWTGTSARARWARTARNVLGAALLGAAALALLNDWLGGALLRAVREFFPQ